MIFPINFCSLYQHNKYCKYPPNCCHDHNFVKLLRVFSMKSKNQYLEFCKFHQSICVFSTDNSKISLNYQCYEFSHEIATCNGCVIRVLKVNAQTMEKHSRGPFLRSTVQNNRNIFAETMVFERKRRIISNYYENQT